MGGNFGANIKPAMLRIITLLCLLNPVVRLLAQTHIGPIAVDARCNIFVAGLQQDKDMGGTLPVAIPLPNNSTQVVLDGITGRLACADDSYYLPDGDDCAGGDTDLRGVGAISGIVHHNKTLFLVGVFVNAHAPRPTTAPERLDFSGDAENYPRLSPKLYQSFFIGDGRTEGGQLQTLVVPKGATHLYLGYADGFGFQGEPGYYDDNRGYTYIEKLTVN